MITNNKNYLTQYRSMQK